jgi:predicted AAA+ superfamily ATPase
MRMILRKQYLDQIKPFMNQDLIKILMGIRRSGKTILLSQIGELLEAEGVPKSRILTLNFESYRHKNLRDDGALYAYIEHFAAAASGKIYLFLDEIQEVAHWQQLVNSVRVDFDCDIYLTGSNSKLLSGELATCLSGRYVKFTVYPFTFREIREFYAENGIAKSPEAVFAEYLRYGGLPQRLAQRDEHSTRTYLEDVLEAIVIKDVVARNKIKNVDLLRRLLGFLLDNIGNTFSGNSLCKVLAREGRTTTVDTVLNYIARLKDAFIILEAQRYDVKGRQLLMASEKYYAADIGLRNVMRSSEQVDTSKLYENVVFLELLARGFEVKVGKLDNQEIDFICYRGNEKLYLQVAYLLDEHSREREFGNLERIEDNYPKYVVSSDLVDLSRGGIVHLNILEFLSLPEGRL